MTISSLGEDSLGHPRDCSTHQPPFRVVARTVPVDDNHRLDVDATHAELRSRGVDVDAEILRMGDPVPPMFWFRDPDGHALLVVQPA
jgi:hypothetical protein